MNHPEPAAQSAGSEMVLKSNDFPVELPYRLIQLYSYKTDIVLDPFMGSGSTGIASLMGDRNYIGYDISQEYIENAKRRIQPYLNQIKFED